MKFIKLTFEYWIKNFGILVLFSQIISIMSIVYISVGFILGMNKSHVEVVDEKPSININKEIEVENIEKKENVNEKKEKEQIRSISDNNIKVETPFMEEER